MSKDKPKHEARKPKQQKSATPPPRTVPVTMADLVHPTVVPPPPTPREAARARKPSS